METNTENKYLANDVIPAYPVHPGSILGEELKARGISQKTFAETIGLQATHLSALIHGSRNFTKAVATKISSGLEGISADLWMKLQERYNIDKQQRRVNTSMLVSGYRPTPFEVQQAWLSQPKVSYGGTLQVTLNIPESDKVFLENLADRLGWIRS